MLNLAEAIVALQMDDVAQEVKRRAETGDDPIKIIDECRSGMLKVGEEYSKGEFFLAELVLSGEIFKKVFVILEPFLANSGPTETRGKVVMATLKGDIHDLGKDITATLLKAYGFEVHNMGVDIEPQALVDKVKEIRPDFVGLSALMTFAMDPMKQATEMLVAEGLRDKLKIMIGGGVTTPLVKDYVGADFQTTDAMDGVNYCLSGGKG